jgi:hypothetical protein
LSNVTRRLTRDDCEERDGKQARRRVPHGQATVRDGRYAAKIAACTWAVTYGLGTAAGSCTD